MNKAMFWKIISFLETCADSDMDTIHWFEAMCLNYSMDPDPIDQLASCLAFYDLKEEDV